MIDLHSHVLFGIDDGPDTIEGSVALARAAAQAGTDILVATPHVSRRYPNDAATIARVAEQLSARLVREGVPLQILSGAEIAMSRGPSLAPAELAAMRIGAGPWLLIEPSFTQPIAGLGDLVDDLHRAGHRVLLAHPERCMAFHRDPLMLRSLVQQGVLCSLTAGSLVGRFGEHVRRFAMTLAREGLAHNVASDAHDLHGRAPGLAADVERAGLEALSEWLIEAVPAAIVGGEEIPSRPPVPAEALERRSWWRRRPKIA